MPREVWGYEEDIYTSGPQTGKKKGTVTQTPRKAFTPKRAPISTKYTDPAAYKKSPSLISSTQGIIGRNPHVDAGIRGKPATGITYTEPQATKDLNAALQKSRDRDHDPDAGGGGGVTTTPSGDKGVTCTGGQVLVNGVCQDPGDTTTEDGGCKSDADCGSNQTCVNGKCVDKKVDDGSCPGCDTTTHDCINGNCTPKKTGGEDDGDGTPSLTTILQPDETPDLQILTDEMDLRNMLSNVLNKNNPLFKQARTRAFQAMAARGIVNSSMAEEAVMSAVMNVAMPIAQRVITDLQEVMKANVNKSNEFKMALNNMYYQELLRRVDAANEWNLERMKAQQVNWQTVLGAKVEGMGIKDDPAYERYMSMLSKLGSQPSWNVAG